LQKNPANLYLAEFSKEENEDEQ